MASASEQSTAPAEQDETTAKQDETTANEEQDETTANEEQDETTTNAEQDETTANEGQDGTAGDEGQSGGSAPDGSESGNEEEGAASGRSIAAAIEDVSDLPGETVNDQDGRKIGQVKDIYGVGEDENPMWVTIESSTGLGRKRQVFVPLARIKKQGDEIRVPYSFDHVHESPDVEPGGEVSDEDDRALRTYYAIGLADQELVGSARSYASQVPEGEGSAHKIDADSAEGPARELDDTPPAKRVAEAYEKQKEAEGEEHRKGRDATADQIFEEDGAGDDDKQSEGEDEDENEDEKKQPEAEGKGEQPEAEGKGEQPEAQEKGEQPEAQEKDATDGES